MSSAAAVVPNNYPRNFLPGLKLNRVEGETLGVYDLSSTSIVPGSSDFLIYLKQLDPEFSIFPGKDPNLTVVYTGGIKDEPERIEGDPEEYYNNLSDEDAIKLTGGTNGGEDDLNPLEIVTKGYKKVDSDIEGYFCFRLRVEDDWKSDADLTITKALEAIELIVTIADHDDGAKEEEEPDVEHCGTMVGESFVIDLTVVDSAGSAPNNNRVFFLDWDLSNIHMRQVFSPEDVSTFNNVKNIDKNILFLGTADNKMYDLTNPLILHVNLFGFSGIPAADLKINVSRGIDVALDLRENVTDTIESAVGATSTKELIIGNPVISSTQGGWVAFEFSAANILQACKGFFVEEYPALGSMTVEDFSRILDPDAADKTEVDEKMMTDITRIIMSVRLSVVIENKNALSGDEAILAKFFVEGLQSNDLFYDSAAMVLKDRANWTEEKLIEWSKMTGYSDLTDFNCIHRFSSFKVTGKDSETNGTSSDHVFEVTFKLPTMEGVKNPVEDFFLLVHHDDVKLSFSNDSGDSSSTRFKCLPSPYAVTEGSDGVTVTFKWTAYNQSYLSHDTDVKVTLFRNPSLKDDFRNYVGDIKKIGSTTSFKKTIGTRGYNHFVSLKIRKAISLGIEDASSLQESVTNFLESLFHLVLKISDIEFGVDISRSDLLNAVDEIAEMFYKDIMSQESSALYKDIIESLDIFHSEEQQDNENVAALLQSILGNILETFPAFSGHAVNIMLEEKDLSESVGIFQQQYDDIHKKFVSVFQMEPEAVAFALTKYPLGKEDFITQGRELSIEIENAVTTDLYTPGLMHYDMSDYNSAKKVRALKKEYLEVFTAAGVNIEGMKSLDIESKQVLEELPGDNDKVAVPRSEMISASRNVESMTDALDQRLIQMLESVTASGDTVTNGIDSFGTVVESLINPFTLVDNFVTNMSDLSSNATSIQRAISIMIPIILQIGSRCPLWPVKAIVNLIKNPLNILKNAVKRGKEAIVKLNSKASTQLKKVVNQREKIEEKKDILNGPRDVIEKIKDIFYTISTLAEAGLIPTHLIRKFIESPDIKSFFDSLSQNISSIKGAFDSVNSEIAQLTKYATPISALLSSIRSKFNSMRPIDNLFRMLKPWVDRAVALFKRVFKWWQRWMFDVLLKPIEWGVNVLLRPFKNTIKAAVAYINPFGSISYIDDIHDHTIGKIDTAVNNVMSNSFNALDSFTKSDKFEAISGRLVDGLAIALRALFEFISVVLVQASKNSIFFDQLIANAGDAVATFTALLNEERKANKTIRLSDVLLKIKTSSIDGPSAEIDCYLSNSVGSSPHTYIEHGTEDKIRTFINNHSDEYEFVPCHLFPEKDVTSPYFQRASQLSWLNASLASILHHKQIVETVKSLGIGSNEYHEFGSGFVPQVSSDGKFTVELYNSIQRGTKMTFSGDTRLPVKKAALQLPDNLGLMLPTIFNYVKEKIFAFKHESFSLATHGSVSWAMLEKVAITKLNVLRDEEVLVGSGMYLLDGLKGNRFKRKTNGNFQLQIAFYDDFRVREESCYPISDYDNLSSDFIMEGLREYTLSLHQVEALQAAARNKEDAPDDDTKNAIAEKMENLNMFIIVRTDGIAHPIIAHDIDENKSILFSTGTNLQPLMDLNDVEEIWTFSVKPEDTKDQPKSAQKVSPVDEILRANAKNRSKSAQKISFADVVSLIDATRFRAVDNIDTYQRKSLPSILDRLGSSFRGCIGGMKSSSMPLFSEVRTENQQSMTSYNHLLDDDMSDMERLVQQIIGGAAAAGAAAALYVLVKSIMGQIASIIQRNNFEEADIVNIRAQNRKDWLYALDQRFENTWTLIRLSVHAPNTHQQRFTIGELEKCKNEAQHQTHKVLAVMQIFDSQRDNRTAHIERQKTNKAPFRQHEWAMTLEQFRKYMYWCMGINKKWDEPAVPVSNPVAKSKLWMKTKRSRHKDDRGNPGERKGYVDAHTMNEAFIIPNTLNTGHSVALNMQPRLEHNNTKVLLSHAWNEDMEQVLSILEDAKKRYLQLQDGTWLSDYTPIWFCCFAQFQVNAQYSPNKDPTGPTVSDQMKYDPFENVLRSNSCTDMLVIQTTTYDPNTRFWCVIELYEALRKQERGERMKVQYLFSNDFLSTYVQNTDPHDRSYRWDFNLDTRLYERIDEGNEVPMFLRNNPGGGNYTIFREGDTEQMTNADLSKAKRTWGNDRVSALQLNVSPLPVWPKLKAIIFRSHKVGCGWEDKFVTMSTTPAANDEDMWAVMQRTIARGQRQSIIDAMTNARRFSPWM